MLIKKFIETYYEKIKDRPLILLSNSLLALDNAKAIQNLAKWGVDLIHGKASPDQKPKILTPKVLEESNRKFGLNLDNITKNILQENQKKASEGLRTTEKSFKNFMDHIKKINQKENKELYSIIKQAIKYMSTARELFQKGDFVAMIELIELTNLSIEHGIATIDNLQQSKQIDLKVMQGITPPSQDSPKTEPLVVPTTASTIANVSTSKNDSNVPTHQTEALTSQKTFSPKESTHGEVDKKTIQSQNAAGLVAKITLSENPTKEEVLTFLNERSSNFEKKLKGELKMVDVSKLVKDELESLKNIIVVLKFQSTAELFVNTLDEADIEKLKKPIFELVSLIAEASVGILGFASSRSPQLSLEIEELIRNIRGDIRSVISKQSEQRNFWGRLENIREAIGSASLNWNKVTDMIVESIVESKKSDARKQLIRLKESLTNLQRRQVHCMARVSHKDLLDIPDRFAQVEKIMTEAQLLIDQGYKDEEAFNKKVVLANKIIEEGLKIINKILAA